MLLLPKTFQNLKDQKVINSLSLHFNSLSLHFTRNYAIDDNLCRIVPPTSLSTINYFEMAANERELHRHPPILRSP